MNATPSKPSFDEVLEACLVAIEERGEVAVDEACERHPEHAERLRRRVQLLSAANLLDLSPGLARLPERVGDFILLERIGTGGMGVVHRARSASTGRFVAVKLVRPELLAFSEAKSRLAREVELSARLHHPSILPVFAVGETDGLPWFAMELVAGASLGAVTAELRKRGRAVGDVDTSEVAAIVAELTPEALKERVDFGEVESWSSWSLDVARAIVDAIAYAHGKGVLHRDLKPSNVLVGVDGRVHLCDFGLASDAGDGSLTRSGSAVGSLPYMPPEVLDGQPADVRSDVYGLGGLAYELVTLHRPFEAESTGALVREILTGRPPSPRVHAPRLPLDFEAVVLRALERDPARRYATASELGEDLDALVDNRPTRARPIGPIQRVARMAQRRPALATAIAFGTLALIAGPIGWQANRLDSALRVARANEKARSEIAIAYDKEVEANARSDRSFRAALAAIGHVLRETAVEELEDVPRLQNARLAAIDRAIAILGEIALDRPDDLDVSKERAELLESRADVLYDLSRYDEAIREGLAAAAMFEPHAQGDVVASMNRCSALHHVAKSLQALARHSEALDFQRETLATTRACVAAGEAPPDVTPREMRRRVAVELISLAETERVVFGAQQAVATLHEAEQILDALVDEEEPGDPQPMVRSTFGRTLRDLGDFAFASGDLDGAGALYEESLEHYMEAYERSPGSRFHVFDLATIYSAIANIADDLGDLELEEEQLREALDYIDQLTNDFPESARYHNVRSEILESLAVVFAKSGRLDEGRGLLEQLFELRRLQTESAPNDIAAAYNFATTANNLANVLLQQRTEPERIVELASLGLVQSARISLAPDPILKPATLIVGLNYLHAIGLTLAGHLDDGLDEIEAFDANAADAMTVRYASDLWSEYLMALPPDGPAVEPGILPPGEYARARLLTALERAIVLGFDDLADLQTNPALDGVRDDPRFVKLLERLGG